MPPGVRTDTPIPIRTKNKASSAKDDLNDQDGSNGSGAKKQKVTETKWFKPHISDTDRDCTMKYQRFKINNPPITDIKDAPKDWNINDKDIDPKDLDAFIKRCHERIEDGILPDIWIRKLRMYEDEKQRQLKIIKSAPKGVDIASIQRVETLNIIKEDLEKRKKSDPEAQSKLVNVNAIIQAYHCKRLVWNFDTVTYWLKGHIIKGPKVFDWEECVQIYRRCRGGQDFWVEGMRGPGLTPICFYNSFTSPAADPYGLHLLYFTLRPPGVRSSSPAHQIQRQFLDDTGSDMMVITHDDLQDLQAAANAGAYAIPVLGEIAYTVVGGTYTCSVVSIEVTMLAPDNEPLCNWLRIEAAVLPPHITAAHPAFLRPSGPWLRHAMYVGSAPANDNILYGSKTKSLLSAIMTTTDIEDAVSPAPNDRVRRRRQH